MLEIAAGRVFAGGYRVERRLGGGGMGAVYVAEQLATGAPRALKLMRPDLVADPHLLRLFEQEARIGHRIESDHIVKVIDAGVDGDTGIPWLAMELLEGEPLATRVERDGAIPREEAAAILLQIGHALAAAHAIGVVHRDLKPENVFLCRALHDGAPFTVKLLDFGIAKVLKAAVTQGTIPIGTPLWMAPEQALGGTVGPGADVWALGLLAFWMLTGRRYWKSEPANPIGALHEALHETREGASARAAYHGREGRLPGGFDGWFGRCVARAPEDRYPDASSARDALRAAFAQPGSSSEPPPSTRRLDVQPPGASYDLHWYVRREREERESLNYLTFPGKPAILWGPRGFGKTWLLAHCLAELKRAHGFEAVRVDAKILDRTSADALLLGLAAHILEARGHSADVPDGASRRSAATRLTRILEREILPGVTTALVLAIDAADAVRMSPGQDDLFALLRAWAERQDGPWPRLRLLLAVSTTPSLLIGDPNRSPFNLTVPVALDDLVPAQVETLARLHRLSWTSQEIERVMDLVGGHPYLLRLLMHRAALHAMPLGDLLDPRAETRGPLYEDVHQFRAWLDRSGLREPAAQVARGAGGEVEPDALHRLVRAGVVVEEARGRFRLRNRLYEIAAVGRS
jgi:serine/threonine protein kinase